MTAEEQRKKKAREMAEFYASGKGQSIEGAKAAARAVAKTSGQAAYSGESASVQRYRAGRTGGASTGTSASNTPRPTALNIAAEAVRARNDARRSVATPSAAGSFVSTVQSNNTIRPTPLNVAIEAAKRNLDEKANSLTQLEARKRSLESDLGGWLVDEEDRKAWTAELESINQQIAESREARRRLGMSDETSAEKDYVGMAAEEVASGAASGVQNIFNYFLNSTENRNTGLDAELHRTVGREARAEEAAAIERERAEARAEAGEPTAATNRRMTHAQDATRINAAGEAAVEEAREAIQLPEADKYVDFGDRYAQQVAEKYREEIEKAPVVAQVAQGVGGMIPTIAANFVVPGSGYYTTFANAAQGATDEALADGASEDMALVYGTAVGGFEILVGKAFDGMAGAMGKGAADELIEAAAKKTFQNNTAAQGAFIFFANSLGEGLEEFATEYADALANRLTVQTDERSFLELSGDANKAFLIGSMTSAVIQGGQKAINGVTMTAQELADETVSLMESEAAGAMTQEETKIPEAENEILSQESEAVSQESESQAPFTNAIIETTDRIMENAAREGGGESTSVNDDPAVHTAEEQARIEEYKRSVDSGIVAFANKVRGLVDPGYRSRIKHTIAPLSDRTANDVGRIVGFDVSGFNHIIDGDGIDHIDRRHGKSGSGDHSMQDDNDLGRIGYVLENYDTVEPVVRGDGTLDKSAKWRSADGKKSQKIKFSKKINGTYYVVEAVPDTKSKNLVVVSAYINDSGAAGPQLNMAIGYAPQPTSETLEGAYSPADSTIARTDIPVNPLSETALRNMDRMQNGGVMTEARRADESVGAAPGGFDPTSRWQMEAEDYHPVNAEAAKVTLENRGRAAFDMPTTDIHGGQTSKHASTLINANITTNEMATALQEAARQGIFSYMAETNATAAERAQSKIEYDGWDAAYGAYKNDVLAGRTSADIVALGAALYNNAVNAGNLLDAMDIASLMVQSSSNTAQAMQALSMVNKASPEMQLYMKVRSIENIRDQIIRKYKDKAPDLEIDEGLLNDYRDTLVSGDKKAEKTAWKALSQNVANQLPSTFADKWNAWRYLAMLGNVRTHIRNVEGNLFMVPVRLAKDIVATSIEGGVSLLSGGKIERTKSFINPASKKDQALLAESWRMFAEDKEAIQSGGKYNDSVGEIEQMKPIFNSRVLEGARKVNSFMLDAEDVAFAKLSYTQALTGWLKANGVTADAMRSGSVSEDVLARAREYAVKEAQKATFRDSNDFSEAVARLGRNYQGENKMLKALNVGVEGVLPFKKTPANILVRGVEYSPVGLLNGVVSVAKAVKGGEVTAAQAIDQLASGITGTALMLLGVLGAHQGWLRGGRDEDEKQQAFNELQGFQNYAFMPGNGKSYTIDNLAPAAMPLFVGVELYKAMTDEGFEAKDIWAAVGRIADPVLEMSCLGGVQELIDGLSYISSGESSLGALCATLALNYLAQGLPTVFGQFERTFLEDEREQTYRYGDSVLFNPTGQYNLGSLANKIPIPGVDYHQIPYIDAWGRRERSGEWYESLVQNFINPHYVSDITTTAVDRELQRLYDAGYEAFPERAAQSTKIGGEYMSAEEYVKYAETKGQTSYNLVKGFMDSDIYDYLDDESRADVISEIYSYAGDRAKREVVGGDYTSQWDDFVDDEESVAPVKALRQAVNSFIDSDYSDSEQIESLHEWWVTLGSTERTEFAESVSGLEKVMNCLSGGMTAAEYGEAKIYHDELNRDEDLTPAQRATAFAGWADKNLGTRAAAAAKNNLTFSFGDVVAAEKYEELRDSGLSSSDSTAIFDAVSGLDYEPGYTSIRDIQQYEAIANTRGVSEADKLAAIAAYAPEGNTYSYYEAAYDSGVKLADFVDILRDIEGYQTERGKEIGKPSQGELYLALANSELTNAQRQDIFYAYAVGNNWTNKNFYAAHSYGEEVYDAILAARR